MVDKQTLGFISVALSAIGYGSYIRSIIQKRTKPHLFSWAVWAVLMVIVFLAQVSKGAAAGAWVTGFSAAACVVIAIFSVPFGEKHITRGDWLAFIGALITIPVWYFTNDPLWAVIIATLIDALAYYPTFRKSYAKPYEENAFTYTMDFLKWIFALFALGNYSLVTLFYPVFLLAANSSLVAMIIWRRRHMRTS